MAKHDSVGEWVRTHLHVPKPSAPGKVPMKTWYWRGWTPLLQIMAWNKPNKEAVFPELTEGTEL